ncbi:MAG: DUF6328 family protein [Patulibacter sp.]
MTAARPGESPKHPERRDELRAEDADAVAEAREAASDDGNGPSRNPRTGETPSERHTRQINELLQETRVAAVGVQVIIGFLLAIPFTTELNELQRDAYVVALLAAVAATALLLSPSVIHRALLHQGQAAWIVAVGTRLVLGGMVATAVALTAASVLVGDRLFDGWMRFGPATWTLVVLLLLWLALPGRRRWQLARHDADRSAR